MNDEKNEEIIITQWQTCVEMANSVSHRRDALNNLFVTLNLALVASATITFDIKSIFILVAGIVLCILWMLLIRNFKLLNKEKFDIINEMEKNLPEKPFTVEWEKLKNNRKYKDGTKLEIILSIAFILLYIAIFIAIVIIKINNGGCT